MGALRRGGTIAGLVIAVLAVLIALEEYESRPRPAHLGLAQTRANRSALNSDGSYGWGRYRHALTDLDYSRASGEFWSHYTSHKHWQYYSIDSEEYFMGFAVANLNYIANGWFYLVDKSDGGRKYEFGALSPFAMAVLETADDPAKGCLEWVGSDAQLKFCAKAGHQTIDILAPLADANGVSVLFRMNVQMAHTETFALLFPLEPNRPAYTQKNMGMAVTGTVQVGRSAPVETLKNALGGMDYTKSIAERITRWKWASFHGRASTGEVVGINLSSDVYPDKSGYSMENAVWLNGKMFVVNRRVQFVLPTERQQHTTHAWSVTTGGEPAGTGTGSAESDVRIELSFTPRGSREEHINLGIIQSDFVQPYGTFDGVIRIADKPYQIAGVWGVVENHFAEW